MELQKKFLKDAEKVSFDESHRQKLRNNISRYESAVAKGKLQFSDLELARKRAANAKHKIINDLDKYLIEFESNFFMIYGCYENLRPILLRDILYRICR